MRIARPVRTIARWPIIPACVDTRKGGKEMIKRTNGQTGAQ